MTHHTRQCSCHRIEAASLNAKKKMVLDFNKIMESNWHRTVSHDFRFYMQDYFHFFICTSEHCSSSLLCAYFFPHILLGMVNLTMWKDRMPCAQCRHLEMLKPDLCCIFSCRIIIGEHEKLPCLAFLFRIRSNELFVVCFWVIHLWSFL